MDDMRFTKAEYNHLQSVMRVGGDEYLVTAKLDSSRRWKITATKNGEPTAIGEFRDKPTMRDVVANGDQKKAINWMRRAEHYIFAKHVQDA